MKRMNLPVHSVGELVCNLLTGEEGQIVRILNSSELRKVEPPQRVEPAYIVSLPPGAFARAREALWLQSEVVPETSVEDDERAAGDGGPEICWVCGKDVLSEDHEVDNLGRRVHVECQRSDSVAIRIESV
jgi:hypothetical protein